VTRRRAAGRSAASCPTVPLTGSARSRAVLTLASSTLKQVTSCDLHYFHIQKLPKNVFNRWVQFRPKSLTVYKSFSMSSIPYLYHRILNLYRKLTHPLASVAGNFRTGQYFHTPLSLQARCEICKQRISKTKFVAANCYPFFQLIRVQISKGDRTIYSTPGIFHSCEVIMYVRMLQVGPLAA
jgi:hypothetical protein